MSLRKIVHVDMDAFYASVEQRDRPELRGKPVIVGGRPNSRGVVCTASYEARAFGVRSAMPTSQAYRLCPQGAFLPPDFPRYQAVSEVVQGVFRRYTPLVEPLSLDEAYLDVTENTLGTPSATRVAEAIRAEILRETGLTASAGVAPNKFLAKVASDMDKPDGLTVIGPERVEAVLAELPVRRIPGVGRVTEERCHRRGIRRALDFLRYSDLELARWFGSAGPSYRDYARGLDPRPVVASRERKSVSVEDTFPSDLVELEDALAILERLARTLRTRIERCGAKGRTVTLKVKYADFEQVTRSRTTGTLVELDELLPIARELVADTEVGERPIRLLGVGLSNLGAVHQLELAFGEPEER